MNITWMQSDEFRDADKTSSLLVCWWCEVLTSVQASGATKSDQNCLQSFSHIRNFLRTPLVYEFTRSKRNSLTPCISWITDLWISTHLGYLQGELEVLTWLSNHCSDFTATPGFCVFVSRWVQKSICFNFQVDKGWFEIPVCAIYNAYNIPGQMSQLLNPDSSEATCKYLVRPRGMTTLVQRRNCQVGIVAWDKIIDFYNLFIYVTYRINYWKIAWCVFHTRNVYVEFALLNDMTLSLF